ncbi:hypothetical protein J2X69_000235 [Algoriphagus sp. 4150]|uniref:hypothetical protein n=1 Tax=Algoriphagus sp. 4150 TaxID=2817756 RepID=UPI00285FFB8D|nr:hypothetical protein [Algoriphagus sp. 4150]MDR7127907.1 hypothetical protein [Algoriphagus sp. 4150]
MEQIKLVFFLFGSFFGIEDSYIIAERTDVKIDTQNHVIDIYQKNVYTIIVSEEDSIAVSEELFRIGNPAAKEKSFLWAEELNSYACKTFDIRSDSENEKLDISLNLKYDTPEQLRDFAVNYVEEEGTYAIVNIESLNIETTTGELRGNYWYFKDEISFSIFPDTPNYPKTSLYEYWEKVKP